MWKKIKCGIVTARYDKNRYIDLMKFGVQQWMARREWGYFGKMDDVGNGKQEEEGRRSVKTGSNREGEVRAEFILGRGGGWRWWRWWQWRRRRWWWMVGD